MEGKRRGRRGERCRRFRSVVLCYACERDVRMRVVLQEGVVCGIEVDNKKRRDERREEEKGNKKQKDK